MGGLRIAAAYLLASLLLAPRKQFVCAQEQQRPIRINAGGQHYKDSIGNEWLADNYYNEGRAFHDLFWIFNTNDRSLYRSNRYDDSTKKNLTYEIPIQNGNYIVILHFAELFTGVLAKGARVFDVFIEDREAFKNVDIYAEAGGYTALAKKTLTQVNDGSLTIEFIRRREHPLISAIEVIPSGVPYIPKPTEMKPPALSLLQTDPTKPPKTKPVKPVKTEPPTQAATRPPTWPTRPTLTQQTPRPTPKATSAAKIESSGGMALWAAHQRDTMRYSDFDGDKFSSAMTGPNIHYRWSHVRGASSPTRDEMIAIGVTDEGRRVMDGSGVNSITAVIWNRHNWSRVSTGNTGNKLGAASDPVWNNAHVAYESQSGDALLVWHDNRRLLYSEWNGKEWTTASSISGVSGEPQWFDIASNPRSNEIVVALSDSSKDVYVLVWNGSRWASDPLWISTGSHQAGIAVAYESRSGHALVVYGNAYRSTEARYRVWNGSRWSKEASLESPLGASTVRWAVLRPDPNSNRLVLGIHGDEGIWLSVWNGLKWEKSMTISATETSVTNTQSVVYIGVESQSGDAMAVYREGRALRFRTLQSRAMRWSSKAAVPGYLESPSSITLDSEPGSNRIMMLVQDDDGDVHSALWDGDLQAWEPIIRLETDTGEWKNQPFVFLWRSPPTSVQVIAPAAAPTLSPSDVPSDVLSGEPSLTPTVSSSDNPTNTPSSNYTTEPTYSPSVEYTAEPTFQPTEEPSLDEVHDPTLIPSATLSDEPSSEPTSEFRPISSEPTVKPSTASPVLQATPFDATTEMPSLNPSPLPSENPSASPPNNRFRPIYINAGGDQFTDVQGTVWEADAYYSSGAKAKTSDDKDIVGAVDSRLYRTERWDSSSSKRLVYDISVPEGEYEVTLYFSENYNKAQVVGGRVFDVAMEDEIVFADLDIFEQSGGPYTALNKTTNVSVSDGSLTIEFINDVQRPKVSGIEIHSVLSNFELDTPISSAMPTAFSSGSPSILPSTEPSDTPTQLPSLSGTTSEPTSELQGITPLPTVLEPFVQPSREETQNQTLRPSTMPSSAPTSTSSSPPSNELESPTRLPSRAPNLSPVSKSPSALPQAATPPPTVLDETQYPTLSLSTRPGSPQSGTPSLTPTVAPSTRPSFMISESPSTLPTQEPNKPTVRPSINETTTKPTFASQATSPPPTVAELTLKPSQKETQSPAMSSSSSSGTNSPSLSHTKVPSQGPSSAPTISLSSSPSDEPGIPTQSPSYFPSIGPSTETSKGVSETTSAVPTIDPSSALSLLPSGRQVILEPTTESEAATPPPTASELNVKPSLEPSSQVSSAKPSQKPSVLPTFLSSGSPFSFPTGKPTVSPSVKSERPTQSPSSLPTTEPTFMTGTPSLVPTAEFSNSPTMLPSAFPTFMRSGRPSTGSTSKPTSESLATVTSPPTLAQTEMPSLFPSLVVSPLPSRFPSSNPSVILTSNTPVQLASPSLSGNTEMASLLPSDQPSSQFPSLVPSDKGSDPPTSFPSKVTIDVTPVRPTQSAANVFSESPSSTPSAYPTKSASSVPSRLQSASPTNEISIIPSAFPSQATSHPSSAPSQLPTFIESTAPSSSVSNQPTMTSSQPSRNPSTEPSNVPTNILTADPSSRESDIPSAIPTQLPTSSSTTEPSLGPSSQLSLKPSRNPSTEPSLQPTSSSSNQPSSMPSLDPSLMSSSSEPSLNPSEVASNEPSPIPSKQPTPLSPTVRAQDFKTLRINSGGEAYTDSDGVFWAADRAFKNGESFKTSNTISGTSHQYLFQTVRSTASNELVYDIDVPNGEYLVTLYFVDIFPDTHVNGGRVFDVLIEGFGELKDIDIFKEVGGFAVSEKQAPVAVSDRDLTIELKSVVNAPLISAIEVEALGTAAPRQAHAVSGGPYFAIVPQEDVIASVTVDGSFSHSHGPDAEVISWKWTLDGKVVGSEEILTLELPIGTYELTLEVVDSDNAKSSDSTIITIELPPLPEIESLKPDTSNVAGGGVLVITGTGFSAPAEQTTVFFGSQKLSGPSDIKVIDDTTIEVKKIPSADAGSVEIQVETPSGISNTGTFTYIEGTPIAFSSGTIIEGSYGPTCITCGPDGTIYVGTQTGAIIKIVVDDDYKLVSNRTSFAIAATSTEFRSILGIAVDPMDTSSNPAIYVSHSTLFHGQLKSYNGKVSKVSGRDLDVVEDIVTGLPVSDLDHGINGLEFGDNGELYIQVGSNTNAGVPGPLSSTGKQKDGLFSGATLVAYLSRPDFDGNLTYDEEMEDLLTGSGVEVFAAGQRNPYDITLHSNGMLYGTDNGANFGFGRRSVTCDTDDIDPNEPDELNLIEAGKYYGQANRKRGEQDPRQCQWRSQSEPSDDEYTAPIAILESSSDGIIEFQAEHFDGKLRGNLIVSQYKGALWRVELSNDGKSARNRNATLLDEIGGLSLTQGPDGTLFVARNDDGKVIFVTPKDAVSDNLKIKSVFPRRGPQDGGSILQIYGENLEAFGTPTITVGGEACPVLDNSRRDSKLQCRLPSGTGTVDIVVTTSSTSATFTRGYRYILGTEEE